MKRLKDRFLKDNQRVQIFLKEFIDHFQDCNDLASTLIAIEETVIDMRDEHKTEINIFIGMIWILKRITLSESIGCLKH